MIDNPLFFFPFLTGITFIIVGFIMLKFPPKKINKYYGYRTKSSMKSQEVWNFSQKYSAKEMMNLGLLLVPFGLLGSVFQTKEMTAIIIGLGLIVLMIVILIIKVELAIRKKFN